MKTQRLLILLALLSATLAHADSKPAQDRPDRDFYAVLMDGQKIGYSEHSLVQAEGKATSRETMVFEINRGNTAIRIRYEQTTVETSEGKPLRFSSVMDMGVLGQKSEGVIENGKLKLTITSAGASQQREMDWPEGALLPYGLQLLGESKGFAEGTTYTARAFDLSLLQATDVEVKVAGREKVDLLGRVVMLRRVINTMKTPLGQMTVTSYVDDAGTMQKSLLPMMGMKMEIVACSEAFARSKNAAVDFFDRQLVACPVSLADLKAGQAVRYVLQPRPGAEISVPDSDNQAVRKLKDGQLEVTVRLAKASGGAMPYAGSDERLQAATRPARFLESDRKEVADLARQATRGAKDAADAARRIEAFVRKHVSKKNLSVGYASAAEVAVTREGDCTEHAVLVAAMCRAAGLPAEVVMGLAYVPRFGERKDVFVPHAWAQVYVAGPEGKAGTWIYLDAALPWMNTARIALGSSDGDLDSFFELVQTLGCFTIAQAEVLTGAP